MRDFEVVAGAGLALLIFLELFSRGLLALAERSM